MRDEALKSLYSSVAHRVGLPFDVFASALDSWQVIPLKQADTIIGGVIVKGNEIHVGYGIAPTASIMPHIRTTLNALIQKHGFVVTKVCETNMRGLRFCKRLGFVETGRDSRTIHLRCNRSNYE